MEKENKLFEWKSESDHSSYRIVYGSREGKIHDEVILCCTYVECGDPLDQRIRYEEHITGEHVTPKLFLNLKLYYLCQILVATNRGIENSWKDYKKEKPADPVQVIAYGEYADKRMADRMPLQSFHIAKFRYGKMTDTLTGLELDCCFWGHIPELPTN